MPTVSRRHHESSLAAEEEFLAIVCPHEDLVRAEFDAIIAAEWPSLPPGPLKDDDAVERSPVLPNAPNIIPPSASWLTNMPVTKRAVLPGGTSFGPSATGGSPDPPVKM